MLLRLLEAREYFANGRNNASTGRGSIPGGGSEENARKSGSMNRVWLEIKRMHAFIM